MVSCRNTLRNTHFGGGVYPRNTHTPRVYPRNTQYPRNTHTAIKTNVEIEFSDELEIDDNANLIENGAIDYDFGSEDSEEETDYNSESRKD